MRNPFDDNDYDPDRQFRENRARWRRMQRQLPLSDPMSRLNLENQPKGVVETFGERIEASWKERARQSGQLFPEKTVDESGRTITKFHGDIRTYMEPFLQKPVPFKLAKLTHINGKAYLTHQLTTIRVPRGSM